MDDIVERLDEHLRFNGKDQLSRDAKGEIEQLREENQKQREKIMLFNSMIQTEHKIIRVAAQKEGE
jgi:hypothetical protein